MDYLVGCYIFLIETFVIRPDIERAYSQENWWTLHSNRSVANCGPEKNIHKIGSWQHFRCFCLICHFSANSKVSGSIRPLSEPLEVRSPTCQHGEMALFFTSTYFNKLRQLRSTSSLHLVHQKSRFQKNAQRLEMCFHHLTFDFFWFHNIDMFEACTGRSHGSTLLAGWSPKCAVFCRTSWEFRTSFWINVWLKMLNKLQKTILVERAQIGCLSIWFKRLFASVCSWNILKQCSV